MPLKVWLSGGELLVAAALWGFGFVWTIWSLRELNPVELTFCRFLGAWVLLSPLLLKRRWRQDILSYLHLGFWPGVFFALTLVIQTWGLRYTTATKSGFLTTLYVIFVPLLEFALGKKALARGLLATVGLAFIGTLLIVNVGLTSDGQSGLGEGPVQVNLNVGDLLTLLCALLASGQIYAIGMVSPRVDNALAFNLAQTFWAGLVCLPIVLANDSTGFVERVGRISQWSHLAQVGLFGLVAGSTVVAFTLQVRAQTYISPTVSSLLFLMESPFALVLASIFLAERLGPLEALGAGLIFTSAILANVIEARGRKLD